MFATQILIMEYAVNAEVVEEAKEKENADGGFSSVRVLL
jgi:hypothetical protein